MPNVGPQSLPPTFVRDAERNGITLACTEELLGEAAPGRAPDGAPWYAHLDGPCGPDCQPSAVSVEETDQ